MTYLTLTLTILLSQKNAVHETTVIVDRDINSDTLVQKLNFNDLNEVLKDVQNTNMTHHVERRLAFSLVQRMR